MSLIKTQIEGIRKFVLMKYYHICMIIQKKYNKTKCAYYSPIVTDNEGSKLTAVADKIRYPFST